MGQILATKASDKSVLNLEKSRKNRKQSERKIKKTDTR